MIHIETVSIPIVTVNHSSDNNNDGTSMDSLQETYDTRGRRRWIVPRLSLMHRNLTYQERYLACVRHKWPNCGKRLHRARNAQTLQHPSLLFMHDSCMIQH